MNDYGQLKRDAETPFKDTENLRRLAAFAVTMLPFLDPAPVTEEALRAEGFEYDEDDDLRWNGWLILPSKEDVWIFHGFLIKAMGDVRHLLAVMKGGGGAKGH